MYKRVCPDWYNKHQGKKKLLFTDKVARPGETVEDIGICQACLNASVEEIKQMAARFRSNVERRT
jgi:hypothetical protein